MGNIKRRSTQGNNLLNNEIPRYHYLEFPQNIPVVPSVIDFKHYFSVNVLYLKKLKKRNSVCRLSELYREDVSQRFNIVEMMKKYEGIFDRLIVNNNN